MGSRLIVFDHPCVEVALQLADCLVKLLAEGDAIELVEHGLVEALANSIGLRALGLGSGVIDILYGEIEFIFMAIMGAAIFGAAICQNALERHALVLVERNDAVIKQIGGGDRRLAVIELGKADLGIGVDESLLVNASNTLEGADVEGVLSAAITRAFTLEFAMVFFVGLCLLQRGDLSFGEDQAVLRHLDFERLQAVLHGRQIVAQPDRAHPERRHDDAALQQFVGDADLAEGGLFDPRPTTAVSTSGATRFLSSGLRRDSSCKA